MMRVGIVCPRLSHNDGEGRVNYEIAIGAAEAGHKVVAIATHVEPELLRHPRISWARMPGGSIPTNLLRNIVFAAASSYWLRRHRATLDVVHTSGAINWERSDLTSVHFLHTTWRRSPYFTRVPGLRGLYHDIYSRWKVMAERRMFAASGLLVCVSEMLGRDAAQIGGAPAAIEVIENGIDTTEFSPGPRDRARFGLPENETIALFVGELHTARKNLEAVLRALPLLPGLHLAVAGSRKGHHLNALVNELKIGDRVHFLGFIVDMVAVYRAADLFVFPSRYEPWGMVVAEAMATGLAVVTSNATGASSMITPECGVIVDNPEDVETLANAIRTFASSSTVRDRARVSALAAVEARSWRSMANRYVALYEQIAARRDMAQAPMK